MLYSIIPPILIVLSLAGIIIFFMKKSPQIAILSDEDNLERENDLIEAGFFRRLGYSIKNIGWSSIGHSFLAISDKITRRARIVFLKLESKSKNLNDSIRNKRNENKLKNRNVSNASKINMEEDAIIEKLNNYQPEKKKNYLAESKKAAFQDRTKNKKEKDAAFAKAPVAMEEKIIRPTVSDRVTTPKAKAEMKDRLEGLLIERIAANPKDIEAYERLGEYYMEIDSVQDAKECFKQVLKLDPKNSNVKYRMRRLESMLRKR